jgi:hypothetical protein
LVSAKSNASLNFEMSYFTGAFGAGDEFKETNNSL